MRFIQCQAIDPAVTAFHPLFIVAAVLGALSATEALLHGLKQGFMVARFHPDNVTHIQ
jgi:hypothetical protein